MTNASNKVMGCLMFLFFGCLCAGIGVQVGGDPVAWFAGSFLSLIAALVYAIAKK